MQVIEFIKNYWSQLIMIATFLSSAYMYVKHTTEATKCSLRNDILSIYEKARERGNKITQYELEAITHSADLYFKLKGNSFIKAIIEKVSNFEIIE